MPRISAALFCAVLSLSLPLAAQSPNVSGKWAGIFDVVHSDGSVEPGSAFLSLAQQGSALTGSAGDSPAHQSAFSTGRIEGNNLTLTLTLSLNSNSQVTVQMNLALDGDHLRGTATGVPGEPGSKIVIDAVRADSDWKPSAPVAHTPDRLYETVAALDKKLFEAYNTCDLNTLSSLVSEDLEFYHDKTGLAVGRPTFVDAIRNNICGKVQRVLVPGTLEVHRLSQYGAVEMGVHRFTHPGDPTNIGEAKFITVWRLKDGQWQLTRAISYDHAPAK